MSDTEENQEVNKIYDRIAHQRIKRILTAFGKFALKNPGLLLTIGYLNILFSGGMYQLGYFERFRIDILEYATLTDFLLQPFRSMFALFLPLMGLVSILLFGSLIYAFLGRPSRKINKKKSIEWIYIIMFLYVILLFLGPFLFGYHEAGSRKKTEERPTYDVMLQSNNPQPEELRDLYLIGATSNFFFFSKGLKHETKYTVPTSNIAFIKRVDRPLTPWEIFKIALGIIWSIIVVCFFMFYISHDKIKLAIRKNKVKKYCEARCIGVVEPEFAKELEQQSEKLLNIKRKETETQVDFIKRISEYVGYNIPEDIDFTKIESQ